MLFLDWALVAVLVCAALMDAADRRRGRRIRRADEMLARRGDIRADAWSTQHSGIPVPVDGVIKDRGVPGARRR